MGSHDNLIVADASAETETLMSIDEQVTADYPPTYIWCGDADKTVPPENTKNMAAALEASGVPVSCEIFPGVDHGVGPGTGTAAEGWLDQAVDFWMARKRAASAQ
jgi:acetyl esterase/lipase